MPLFPIENSEELFYRIETWTDDGKKPFRTLAAVCNHAIASAAFFAAVREYKNSRITMREGIKVNREYVPEHLKVIVPAAEILKDAGIVEPIKDVFAIQGLVQVRSAGGIRHYGVVDLHQTVVALRKNGHTALADQFSPSIEKARKYR
jgi:hypothetical protein